MKFIALTMIANPDVDNGVPTLCLIMPDVIIMVLRGRSAFMKYDFPDMEIHKDQIFPKTVTHHPSVECSVLYLGNGHTLCVEETVEEIRSKIEELSNLNKIGFQ